MFPLKQHLTCTHLFELFGQNGVQERIATAVQRQNENCKDFSLFQINQINSSCGSQSKKCNWSPTNKIGKNEQGHPFGNPAVV